MSVRAVTAQDMYGRVLTAIHDAMHDDSKWSSTSALIDEACGATGNALLVGEGPMEDFRVSFAGLYYRGQRRADLERLYLETYYPIDECVPRMRRQPDGRVMRLTELYTDQELKTSVAYNEGHSRVGFRDGLCARIEGLDGSYMTWALGDPATAEGWGPSQTSMFERLVPRIREYISVRQALVRAEAWSASAAALLDNRRIGALHLDRRGAILEANDRALALLRDGNGLSDQNGVLSAVDPDDNIRLEQLLADALPVSNSAAISGSMLLGRPRPAPSLVVNVKPMAGQQLDYGARRVAAIVLINELGSRIRIDPGLVSAVLGLTQEESRVAVGLAEGRSVDEMAQARGNTKNAVYWHLKRIYRKLSISRQAELVRLVLSLGDLG